MCFRFPSVAAIALAASIVLFPLERCAANEKTLTVCADPHNLPFSSYEQQGFENRIAELIASDLHVRLVYTWQRMDRGFVREYINNSVCQVVLGIPSRYPLLLTTEPYYRSTFVFVFPRDGKSKPSSLNDAALRTMKIGIQAVGEEYTTPGDALARRGLQNAIVPFHTNGGDEDELLSAVAAGKIDTAIVWGPPAGFFIKRDHLALDLVPIIPQMDPPGLPFTFAISVGVRKGNLELRDQLNLVLRRHQSKIRSILSDYGVPQIPLEPERTIEGKAQS